MQPQTKIDIRRNNINFIGEPLLNVIYVEKTFHLEFALIQALHLLFF